MTKVESQCVLCGGHRLDVLYPDELGDRVAPTGYDFSEETRKTYRIVKCGDCGLVYVNPMPDLSSAYADHVDEIYLASSRQRHATAAESVRQLRQYAPDGGRLLDIGCATGFFLDDASKYYNVEGIELSRWASSIASKKHKVHNKPLEELNFDSEFDVVTLWGVIEHFSDPKAEIQRIAAAMKTGATVAIYTGDVDAWLPRLLGKKWWWYQGMHLFYFSKSTLSLMLEKCGLEVIGSGTHTVYFQLFSLANSLRRYPLGRMVGWLFELPLIRDVMIPLRLSGEMVVYARKR